MPFSVRVNNPKNRITLVCWGDITVDDMMEYERRYWAGPEHEGFHHIIDLQVSTLKFDLTDGLMLATHATPSDLNAYAGARTAIVVGDEEQQITATAYRDARHAMCNPDIREVGVFFTIEDAKAWVESSEVVRAKA